MSAPTPLIDDTRPDGHSSLGVLPRLGNNDYVALQEFYGFEHLTQYGYDAADPGELYLQLFMIELKAGPALIQPRVFDQYEGPIDRVVMWLSWPGAEPIHQDAFPKYKQTGVYCVTDSEGSCGWAYSGESHIDPPNGGPYTVWGNAGSGPYGELVGSDALDKLGWWDDHITPNPWFQITEKDGNGQPPITGDAYLVDLAGDGETILKHIRWIEGPPGPNALGSLAFMQDGEIVMHIPWEGAG